MKAAFLSLPQTKRLAQLFGETLRFVGGCVRNSILDIPVTDIDAATTLTPDAVMALLAESGIKAIPTGIGHGTVTAVIDKRPFEITTLRKDVETFGRHAKVEYTDDWETDASRRDFTMNALYLSAEGELFDYFGGETDLRAGRVRFIGDAGARIAEDYLRVLRFFRFHAHYGKGDMDKEALAACAAAAKYIDTLSGERIQQEMMKLLAAPAPSVCLAVMQKTGVLKEIIPGADLKSEKGLEKIESMPQAELRLAALLSEATVATVAQRWKLSNALARKLSQLISVSLPADLPVKEQKKYLRAHGAETFRQLVLLSWARNSSSPESRSDSRAIQKMDSPRIRCANSGNDAYPSMLALADGWEIPVFPVTGDDLKQRGLQEGKALGAALKTLEEKWEASDYTLTKEELLRF